MKELLDETFWTQRYLSSETGWDIGHASTPLVAYIDQLTDKDAAILMPGGGNGYEVEYLYDSGFRNIFLLDISKEPLKNIKRRIPSFPDDHLIHEDFFKHEGQYDLILEQTFFCALHPELRSAYAKHMYKLLKPGGKLAGLWFNFSDRARMEGPPFNGDIEEYRDHFKAFDIKVFESCYNSITPRQGSELFAIMQKPK